MTVESNIKWANNIENQWIKIWFTEKKSVKLVNPFQIGQEKKEWKLKLSMSEMKEGISSETCRH